MSELSATAPAQPSGHPPQAPAASHLRSDDLDGPAATPLRTRSTRPHAELIGVTKRFGDVTALDEVTLEARPGEVLAVLGPNGAGKTTAISCMLGLMKPTHGEARLFGRTPRDSASRMRVGTMLQISGVPETLTVREHLTSFATYYPSPLPVQRAVEMANLTTVADRQYGKLSGGQKQRLHFALAMVGNPDLLFLDEPTTGLDVASRRDFWNEIRDFLGGERTVVLTTHNLEEADALADRVAVIDKGRIVFQGTPAEIKQRGAGRRVRAVTSLSLEEIHALPGVAHVERVGATTSLLTSEPEAVVMQLLSRDVYLSELEVSGVGLEEAFLALTGSQDDDKEISR